MALDHASGRGFISDRGEGYVVIFDLKTNAVLGTVPINAAPDAIINNCASKRVYLSGGSSQCLIPVPVDIDPSARAAEPAIELGGYPSSLVSDEAGKIYVSLLFLIPKPGELAFGTEVAIVDSKARKMVGKWSIAPGLGPGGIAIDTQHHRLFVACRRPPGQLIVLDSENGRALADLQMGRRCSALAFDGGYLFAICPDGINIVKESSSGKFEVIQELKTPLRPGPAHQNRAVRITLRR